MTVEADISYRNIKRNPKTEGRFYTNYVRQELGEKDPYQVLLKIKGKGHYIGTILQATGKEKA